MRLKSQLLVAIFVLSSKNNLRQGGNLTGGSPLALANTFNGFDHESNLPKRIAN